MAQSEAQFEKEFIELLTTNFGWEPEVLKNPTEQDLIQNWKEILFNANQGIDQLNGIPLTDSEMDQIIEQINALKTPLKLNAFINGKSVSICRDNPLDTLHYGKEVSLNIYNRHEISAGKSRYQVAQQVRFSRKSPVLNDRRGDITLLINGMPLFHIELKRSGTALSQACHQIEKYSHEGVFTGLFLLVQIFVAMTPEEMVYFANVGTENKFKPEYYFQWADFNNEPYKNWKQNAKHFLSIPMAHQIIGFYTVADEADNVLKVMRSYQYYAAHAISDKVTKADWKKDNQRGGYIWHTTGSGKTLTSFKSAQLIANSKDADKVVFLMDRIELGTQSLKEYRNFAEANDSIQDTEDTQVLIDKLKSNNPAETLIVSSIQKMSNIQEDGLKSADLENITSKRIVFIIDECHRSVFGDMLYTIKKTFRGAIFFGFTGTPIHDENQKKNSTTSDIFGDELHRYSIADGIRDKNVLGFDPYKILTFKDKDLRKAIALHESKAKTEEEAIADPDKSKVYYHFINSVPMAGCKDKNNKGIEDYLPTNQYRSDNHKNEVVKDICDNFVTLSHNYKFHAIFATSSIHEAIDYYRLLKATKPELKITCLFDPHIDNNEGFAYKEEGLVEIITDYNTCYGKEFSLSNFSSFKKDVSFRLAHKEAYKNIEHTPDKQLDILIVVDQMLTGFDSKWVNTLYMDKVMEYQNIIQAFSRTNRLFGFDKPFGIIRYYRKPHTMDSNVLAAIKLYSGDRPICLFALKLPENINKLNSIFADISKLFNGVFDKLPTDPAERGKFADLFKEFNEYLESAKLQGFHFQKLEYTFDNDDQTSYTLKLDFNETTYLSLILRYKELFEDKEKGESDGGGDISFDIVGHLTEIDTGKINSDFMNSRFDKYIKALKGDEQTKENALNDLHKSFSILTNEEQKFANMIIRDLQRGDINISNNKTLRDYINEYQHNEKLQQIQKIIEIFGLDENLLKTMMSLHITEANLDEFSRFTNLKASVNKEQVKKYFDTKNNTDTPMRDINIAINSILKRFLLEGYLEEE